MLSGRQAQFGSRVLVWRWSLPWQEERLFCSASCFLLKKWIPMKTLHPPAGGDNEIGVCDVDSPAHLNANLHFISLTPPAPSGLLTEG